MEKQTIFELLSLFLVVFACIAFRASSALAAPAPVMPQCLPQRKHRAEQDKRQYNPVARAHRSSPPSCQAANAATHATAHCSITTPIVASRESSSRRIVAIAATQGV